MYEQIWTETDQIRKEHHFLEGIHLSSCSSRKVRYSILQKRTVASSSKKYFHFFS